MSYEIIIKESVLSSTYIPGWNLGEVYLTSGFDELLKNQSTDKDFLEDILKSHLDGDYGLISTDSRDLKRMNEARKNGLPFMSYFNKNNEYVKIVTSQGWRRTVICLQIED